VSERERESVCVCARYCAFCLCGEEIRREEDVGVRWIVVLVIGVWVVVFGGGGGGVGTFFDFLFLVDPVFFCGWVFGCVVVSVVVV
jgi:hypothetical protein